jgi:uncharacterized protein YggE
MRGGIKVKRRLLLAVGLALIVIVVGAVGCYGDFGFPEPESTPTPPESSGIILSQQSTGIWVAGEGKVSVVPDVAILSLGIEAQEETVAEAQQQAAEAMEAVMAVLDDHGIAKKDIKTQYFSIYPVRRWENDKEILIGYRVTNMVSVKIRKMDDTGVIIDAVAEAGGDYTRISSISFTVDNPSDYCEEAREKAMADAEAKAKQLADLAGVDLGRATFISEGTISPPVPREYYVERMAVPAPSPTTPISPGETEVRLTVQVVYSIE